MFQTYLKLALTEFTLLLTYYKKDNILLNTTYNLFLGSKQGCADSFIFASPPTSFGLSSFFLLDIQACRMFILEGAAWQCCWNPFADFVCFYISICLNCMWNHHFLEGIPFKNAPLPLSFCLILTFTNSKFQTKKHLFEPPGNISK